MKIYDYIIHLPNKIFYPFLFRDNKIYNNFQKNGYAYFENQEDNIQISKHILENINFEKIKDIIESKKKINPKVYSINIFENLEQELKTKIINFFNNPDKIKLTSSMLGYKTKFRNVALNINFYNKNNKQDEGAKMFHRDSDSLQDQVKIFLLVNNISNDCGMFYFIPKYYLNENYKLPFEKNRESMAINEKWRNYDSTINSLLNSNNKKNIEVIKNLEGKQGEILFVDTGKVYHKGGFVSKESNYRVLLQAVYTPVLSLSNWNKNRNKTLTFIQQKLTTLRIKLRKTVSKGPDSI